MEDKEGEADVNLRMLMHALPMKRASPEVLVIVGGPKNSYLRMMRREEITKILLGKFDHVMAAPGP